MPIDRKKRENTKLVIKNIFYRFFALLFLMIIFFLFYSAYRAFRKSAWDGKNNFNLIIQSERTFIYPYRPGDDIVNIISLPNNLFIETANGYGEYKLKNIYQLGEMERIGGGDLLSRSIQNFLNVPIDGYIVKSQNSKFKVQNKNLEKGKLASLYFCLLIGKCETNLTKWDLIRLLSKTGKLKLNNIRVIDIEKTAIFKKEKLIDGSEALRLKSLQIENFSQKYFTDKNFLTAGVKISIFNATDYQGLAKNASSLLINIGGEILSTKDADKIFDQSVVYYADSEKKETYPVKKICQIFKIDKILHDNEIVGDVMVVLGKDFSKRFYSK